MADLVFSGVTLSGGFSITPPPTIPNAPTIGTATATGTTTATVAFTAPAFDGGSTITSYTATSSPGSITGTLSQAGSGTITVTGLTSNTSYTFTVTATNIVGTSSASSASNSITTGATPVNTVAPVVSGTARVGQTLSTTDGTWTGTATITFTYQWQRNGVNISSATSSTYILVDADAGNLIRCVVTGTNAYGNSSANSNATSNVTSVPGAPTIGTATATGKTTATVTYTGSANTGYPASTPTYTATSSPGGLTGTGTSPITVSGLTSGTSYTFTVTATNSIGTSAASAASNSVTTLSDPSYIAYYGDTVSFNDLPYTASDSSGNLYWIGTYTLGGNYAYIYGKYNSTGVIQWQRSLNSVNFDFGFSTTADSSGNVFIAGQTGTGTVYAKYDSSGTLQWQRIFNKSAIGTQGGTLKLDSSGNLYLLAIQSNGVSNILSALISKYDSTPTLQWTRSFGNTSGQGSAFYFNVGDFALDSSGNIYISGTTDSDNAGVICKYNNSGTLQWQRKLTISGSIFGTPRQSVVTDTSGNVYAVFNGNNNNGFTYIFKYNTSGTLQWQKRYAMPSGNANYGSIAIDSSNNLYVLGNNSTTGVGYIVKLNTSGEEQWQRSMTATSLQFQCGQGAIAVDNAGSIYFSMQGNTGSPNNYSRYAFAKLPNDGSKTGTYAVGTGSMTYAVSTDWTLSTTTFTETAGSSTSATVTWTDGVATMTQATTTVSSTTTTIA